MTPQAIQSYHEQGFYLAQGMIDLPLCQRVYDQGMRLMAQAPVPHRTMQPHRTDALFMDMLREPRIVSAVEALADEEVFGAQTMFYIKPAGSTGHGWHQDSFYFTSKPKPVLAAWLALQPITQENGALIVFPGSHRGPLLEMLPHSDERFKNHRLAVQPPADIPPHLVTMEPGDVLFFDGVLIHGSYPNRSATSDRPAYIAHYVPCGSFLPTTSADRVALHEEVKG